MRDNLFNKVIQVSERTVGAKVLPPKKNVVRVKFNPPKKGIFYLYFLACQKGWYYVGVTKNWEDRIKQHSIGKGAKLTQKHRPTAVIGIWKLGEMNYEDAEKIEDDFVMEQMAKYGGKVRGGNFLEEKINVGELLKCYIIPKNVENRFLQIRGIEKIDKKKYGVDKNKKAITRYTNKQIVKMLRLKEKPFEEAVNVLYEFYRWESGLPRTMDYVENKVLKNRLYCI